ncbi:hypothetical protein AVEN_213894-1 [Araneus ventricosus]|uniref:Uncharacterized protein n=1 Tax=Araneus ventricosus TaxID=182803 RepID=A0A4Y2KE07_ARAVE|nr:hypothetical protein AVEN_213894-1 [Araneus ventricosus]
MPFSEFRSETAYKVVRVHAPLFHFPLDFRSHHTIEIAAPPAIFSETVPEDGNQILERKMVIGEVDVITTEKREKEKRKQMEDKRIKRKMVKTDADAAHAQSLELLELNTMSSSLYTDTDVITMEYQS